MKTVLLITARFDPAADLLLAELRRRGASCVRWNTHEFPLESSLNYRAASDGFSAEVVTDGRAIDLSTIGSIWWQWDRPAGFPPDLQGEERRFAETEAHLAVSALMTVGDFFWINHPARENLAKSKPAQLFMAGKLGMEIPKTLVSNDPDEVRRFVAKSKAEIVYKGLSQPHMVPGTALFTGLLTQETLANLDLIRLTPGIFQERVEKAYELRVTVIGSKVFAVKIDSQKNRNAQLDWRRALHDVGYETAVLSREVEEKILAFMRAFGLFYGAFDFIVTPDGRHIFLEINPSGQYMWLECATDLGITAALADALMEPCLC
jgi:glutathione synthase/RimK-type ligase-like ATP-grasp enzyme